MPKRVRLNKFVRTMRMMRKQIEENDHDIEGVGRNAAHYSGARIRQSRKSKSLEKS